MAIAPRGGRATRLSSGSVQKRSYADDTTESSEEDDVIPSRTAGKGKGRQSAASLAAAKRAKKEEKAKRKKYADSEEDSASDFVDDDASESSDAGALDEDDSEDDVYDEDSDDARGSAKKRRGGPQKSKTKARGSTAATTSSPASVKARRAPVGVSDGEVMQIARAPSGPSPSDRISQHTLQFMADLQDPVKNDREWFAVHKNIYDWIHQNWLNFTETCVDVMIDRVDDTVAWMKPKDLVERIYRDVRFSNDKTPYKRHLSWCMSRNGKKGNYAKYYFSLMGNDQSGLYAGVYEASKEDLETIRGHMLNKTAQGRALQQLVKDPAFIQYYGAPPKSAKDTKRTSLWGSDDELKRAPKGYEPDHPDVQWLRLKSYTIGHKFSDEEILSSNFMDKLVAVGRQAARLVDVMNEMLHGAPPLVPANS